MITDWTLGDGRLISSRASLTAAMIEAAITSVKPVLFLSLLLFARNGSAHLSHVSETSSLISLASLRAAGATGDL
jgi:hypothetical protein